MKLLVVTVLLALAAKVQAGSTMTHEIETADDNVENCLPNVRTEIQVLKRDNKNFHFECAHGYARKIFASPNAAIFKDSSADFARQHWQLFLANKPTAAIEFRKDPFDSRSKPAMQQYFQGFQIWNGLAFRSYGVHIYRQGTDIGGDYSMNYVSLLDPTGLKLPQKAKLDCASAIVAAKQRDKVDGHSEEGRYDCDPTPVIIKRFCQGGPALVLKVDFSPKSEERVIKPSEYRTIPVDATSGKACASTWD